MPSWVSLETYGLGVHANTQMAPTTPYSSVPHGDFKYVGYTGVYNVVDYSAVSFPCGVSVDKRTDKYTDDYKPRSDYCQAAHDSCRFRNTFELHVELLTNDR
jgi:hypothetical protein